MPKAHVELAAGSDVGAHERIAVHVEDIDLPLPAPRLSVVVLGSILHGIGHVDLVSNDMDTMGSESRGSFGSVNRTAQRSGVEKLRSRTFQTLPLLRYGQEEGAVEQCETFVDGAAGGVIEGHVACVARARPAGDQAVFRVRNELTAAEVKRRQAV